MGLRSMFPLVEIRFLDSKTLRPLETWKKLKALLKRKMIER